ncbi:hypothetical protein GGI26_004424 [Coemansia sp. RSA 1358]|uniref:Uncharacterized protein n=1 Tax=Coemansia umbellata TaxID=1424467 RepID=A0ABQ8PFY3_9FUNG|nr:hypothetical protein EDC05_005305 [Coemansia umbellata]KAJ2621080.1 hypothetical protein GGI26_004424 [Coemansia sp. RSA 1358]
MSQNSGNKDYIPIPDAKHQPAQIPQALNKLDERFTKRDEHLDELSPGSMVQNSTLTSPPVKPHFSTLKMNDTAPIGLATSYTISTNQAKKSAPESDDIEARRELSSNLSKFNICSYGLARADSYDCLVNTIFFSTSKALTETRLATEIILRSPMEIGISFMAGYMKEKPD